MISTQTTSLSQSLFPPYHLAPAPSSHPSILNPHSDNGLGRQGSSSRQLVYRRVSYEAMLPIPVPFDKHIPNPFLHKLTIYPCSLYALHQTEEIKAANVTHVLSVINYALDPDLFRPFRHFAIDIDDVEDENLLQYFAESNRFIEDGLEGGGGVFVHW